MSHQFNDFPSEVLEKIFENVEDRITAENARLVNSNWKREMDTLIDKKGLFTWTQWKPSRTFCTPLVDSFKKIYLWNYDHPDECVLIPSPSTSFKLEIGNHQEEKPSWFSMEPEAFWNEHGPTTRNLAIDRWWVPLSFIHWVLTRFPNLEGLRINLLSCNKDQDIPFLRANSLPPLPKLKHLEIMEIRPHKPLSWKVVKWFLEPYAPNLVSLKLPCNFLMKFTPKTRFDNLQFLMLSDGRDCLYESIKTPPKLTHLSIMEGIDSKGNPYPIELEEVGNFLRFIDKFADTLVKLNLDVNINELLHQRESDIFGCSSPPKVFPKLTTFSYNFPDGRVQSSLLKKWFLVRFPALQKLQFLQHPPCPYGYNRKETNSWMVRRVKTLLTNAGFYKPKDRNDDNVMKKFVEKERYWKCVPTLENISVRKFEYEPNWEDFELFSLKRECKP